MSVPWAAAPLVRPAHGRWKTQFSDSRRDVTGCEGRLARGSEPWGGLGPDSLAGPRCVAAGCCQVEVSSARRRAKGPAFPSPALGRRHRAPAGAEVAGNLSATICLIPPVRRTRLYSRRTGRGPIRPSVARRSSATPPRPARAFGCAPAGQVAARSCSIRNRSFPMKPPD